MKTPKKPKEPIKLRMRPTSDGSQSLYLDTYVNGKRSYEFLKMYLIAETTPTAKEQNRATLKAANAIKAQRIIELTHNKAGITDTTATAKITLAELMAAYLEKIRRRGQNADNMERAIKHLGKAVNLNTRLVNVDKALIMQYVDYLRKSDLAKASQHSYLARISTILTDAEKSGLIARNPITALDKSDLIGRAKTQREFLTADEVQRLIDTEPRTAHHHKQMFLFACFCGLRLSDLLALKWSDLTTDADGNTSARITQKKTKEPLILPLCADALKWLPTRPTSATDETPIFKQVTTQNIDAFLKRFAKAAGIRKNISIHTARHTFATMLITFGTDLYTVSKLLGHTNIQTTQIYAKLVDTKKTEAVQLFNGKFK